MLDNKIYQCIHDLDMLFPMMVLDSLIKNEEMINVMFVSSYYANVHNEEK